MLSVLRARLAVSDGIGGGDVDDDVDDGHDDAVQLYDIHGWVV
jgi:hypothetical protein